MSRQDLESVEAACRNAGKTHMPDVVERANAELIRAATTKAEGCLMAAFKEEQDPGQLRLRVQSEIRALRMQRPCFTPWY